MTDHTPKHVSQHEAIQQLTDSKKFEDALALIVGAMRASHNEGDQKSVDNYRATSEYVMRMIDKAFGVSSSDSPTCSFCGKSESEGVKLVAGPGVFICNECVGLCNTIFDGDPIES